MASNNKFKIKHGVIVSEGGGEITGSLQITGSITTKDNDIVLDSTPLTSPGFNNSSNISLVSQAYTSIPHQVKWSLYQSSNNNSGSLSSLLLDYSKDNDNPANVFTLAYNSGSGLATLLIRKNTDSRFNLGRLMIGSYITNYAYLAHVNQENDSTTYALKISSLGGTQINAATGQNIVFSLSGSTTAGKINDSIISFYASNGTDEILSLDRSTRTVTLGKNTTDKVHIGGPNGILLVGSGYLNVQNNLGTDLVNIRVKRLELRNPSNVTTLQDSATANRTITLPDIDGTLLIDSGSTIVSGRVLYGTGNTGIVGHTANFTYTDDGPLTIKVSSDSSDLLKLTKIGGTPRFVFTGAGYMKGASQYAVWEPYNPSNANHNFNVAHNSVGRFKWSFGQTPGTPDSLTPRMELYRDSLVLSPQAYGDVAGTAKTLDITADISGQGSTNNPGYDGINFDLTTSGRASSTVARFANFKADGSTKFYIESDGTLWASRIESSNVLQAAGYNFTVSSVPGGASLQINRAGSAKVYLYSGDSSGNPVTNYIKSGNLQIIPPAYPDTDSDTPKTLELVTDISGQLTGHTTDPTWDGIYLDVISTGRTSTGEANLLKFIVDGSTIMNTTLGGQIGLGTSVNTSLSHNVQLPDNGAIGNDTFAGTSITFGGNLTLDANSSIICNDELKLKEISTVAADQTGYGQLYASSSNSRLYWRDSGGNVYDLTATGSGGGSSSAGVNNEVQTSDGSGGFAASNLFFDKATGYMTLGSSSLGGTERRILVEGVNSNIGLRIQSKGTSAVLVTAPLEVSYGGAPTLLRTNRSTNSIAAALQISNENTGGVGGAGIGVSHQFRLEGGGGFLDNAGEISAVLDTATVGSEDVSLRFSSYTGGVSSEFLRGVNKGIQLSGVTNQTIKTAHIQLSQSQIQSLNSTPVTIVSAPGSGRYIQVIAAFAYYNHNGTNYSGGSYIYLTGSGNSANFGQTTTGFINASTGVSQRLSSPSTGQAFLNNNSLEVQADADSTGNGGTIDVYVQYVVIDTN